MGKITNLFVNKLPEYLADAQHNLCIYSTIVILKYNLGNKFDTDTYISMIYVHLQIDLKYII